MKDNTYNLYKNLIASPNTEAINVIDIEGLPHKLGVSSKGFPMFFVITSENQYPAFNIEREFLNVQFDLPCTLVMENQETKDNKFTIITLKSTDEDLQFSFIEFFLLMLRKLFPRLAKKDLCIEIEKFITIFSALSKPPKKKIQGLWAELLIIEQSTNPSIMLEYWHTQPNSKYDFSNGRDKIEVKSTSSEERLHRFSLDQLNPSENSQLLIASVKVRECGKGNSGLSIFDLYNNILDRVTDNELRMHCYTVIFETIGDNFSKAKKLIFDHIEAIDSLRYYNYIDIPKIDHSFIPNSVSDVKFMSDLTHIESINKEINGDLINSSDLYKSIS